MMPVNFDVLLLRLYLAYFITEREYRAGRSVVDGATVHNVVCCCSVCESLRRQMEVEAIAYAAVGEVA